MDVFFVKIYKKIKDLYIYADLTHVTSIFVSENDVSEDGQLTNEYLVKRCEALVNSCKERISRLDLKAAQYDINDLVNKLLS